MQYKLFTFLMAYNINRSTEHSSRKTFLGTKPDYAIFNTRKKRRDENLLVRLLLSIVNFFLKNKYIFHNFCFVSHRLCFRTVDGLRLFLLSLSLSLCIISFTDISIFQYFLSFNSTTNTVSFEISSFGLVWTNLIYISSRIFIMQYTMRYCFCCEMKTNEVIFFSRAFKIKA